MLTIEKYTSEQAQTALDELIVLLQDGVDSGASIGFLPPLAAAEAREYWDGIVEDVAGGGRVLLVARSDGALMGSVQLEFSWKPNARHRAEVQKLMVHRAARRQGIARKLMDAIENEARLAKRSLLVLDTVPGYPAELLYRQIGYSEAGVIPQFARSAQGTLEPTMIFYKLLE